MKSRPRAPKTHEQHPWDQCTRRAQGTATVRVAEHFPNAVAAERPSIPSFVTVCYVELDRYSTSISRRRSDQAVTAGVDGAAPRLRQQQFNAAVKRPRGRHSRCFAPLAMQQAVDGRMGSASLDQINTSNAKNLRLIWTQKTGVPRGHEAAPLVVNDMMYVVTPYPNHLLAFDQTARLGREVELHAGSRARRPGGRVL